MGRFLRGLGVLVCGALGLTTIIEVWSRSWSDRAAMAFAVGVFGLVTALPALRKDERSDRAFAAALLAFCALVGAAVIALYVVHSWAWLGLAISLFLAMLAFEVWDRYAQPEGPSDIDRDIAEKQRRQDEQLEKSFPH